MSLTYGKLMFNQETERILIYLNNRLSNVTLQEIRLKPLNNGIVHVTGDISDFKIGDRINIASEKLIVSGRIIGRDEQNNILFTSIEIAFIRG
ncbi:hypothetical protein ANME2D_02094 [Candidatus Methanoperedens nitroreducens]|uniref:Uncharacterized protein n=1 Tax=Candidatus Methanoperedens nitratireducens TaxID=1392998 RepID=A0A062V1Y5_9EURY|nr:hypothetical protein [Candidatus Methanoperedens nitroreducens]KCZ71367.1 hypothetical protein ANME2D_02094 [Candidatus Methanoperedens nitroreducens]MDJ1420996.1 hypothetical protein [Candidatus Methanoperedens sp.]